MRGSTAFTGIAKPLGTVRRSNRYAKVQGMISQLGQEFSARTFLCRALVAAIVLVATIAVSVIWEKMVYTIPVLAVLLFLASGLRGISGGTSRRNLDQEEVEMDADSAAGMDAG